jgi:hypothetical protein
MSTPAQIAANQANAQHSTGPKTAEGLAASTKNNRKHGLTMTGSDFTLHPDECQEDFDRLLAGLRVEHQPSTETEALFVDHMAEHEWLRKRATRLQEDCFDSLTGHVSDPKLFTLYLRYQTTHERAFHKCLNDLLKLRSEKRKAEIGFESQKRREAEEQRLQEKHEMQQRRKELGVLTAGAQLEDVLITNFGRYYAEIGKDPAKDAKYSELLTRNGFNQAA